jgi:transposase-like protein
MANKLCRYCGCSTNGKSRYCSPACREDRENDLRARRGGDVSYEERLNEGFDMLDDGYGFD